jgi:hypothetical protein
MIESESVSDGSVMDLGWICDASLSGMKIRHIKIINRISHPEIVFDNSNQMILLVINQ